MEHICDQGKELQQEVSMLWSYRDDEKEVDWMLSRLQGKSDPSAEGGTGSLCLLDWKTQRKWSIPVCKKSSRGVMDDQEVLDKIQTQRTSIIEVVKVA